MKKDYQKPEVELISLATTEAVTSSVGGEPGVSAAPDEWA